MGKIKCEICGRVFKDEDGLAQHHAAKHTSAKTEQSSNKKVFGVWIIGIFSLLLVIIFVYWIAAGVARESAECTTIPAIEQNIGGHQNLALHIHAQLQILIDGKEQSIPADIGIAPNIMRPLHTHDASGEVHIEGPCKREYTLGEFFQIWNKEFNGRCIFDKCTDKGTLKMFADGKESKEFGSYILRNEQNILIEFKSNT